VIGTTLNMPRERAACFLYAKSKIILAAFLIASFTKIQREGRRIFQWKQYALTQPPLALFRNIKKDTSHEKESCV